MVRGSPREMEARWGLCGWVARGKLPLSSGSSLSQSAELRDFYDGYYNDAVGAKRTIAASNQSII
jgi:hypothetical protein